MQHVSRPFGSHAVQRPTGPQPAPCRHDHALSLAAGERGAGDGGVAGPAAGTIRRSHSRLDGSTNLCWNEQQVARGEQVGTPDHGAARVATSGARWVPLDTLHSLADFCYLFRRTVAEQLGSFDEAYGAGPCWEMDFTTRAARAGWQALWVADAYVHRAPPSPARAQVIRRFFTASKQLYQDRFCGLDLQGVKPTYEAHCRGEACPRISPP